MTFWTRTTAFFTAFATLFSAAFMRAPKPVYGHCIPPEKQVYDAGSYQSDALELFVSPYGNDNADGTQAHPLATLAEAKARTAALPDTRTHVTVWLREGVYRLSEPLRFTADDRQNVTYRAYPGETVSLSGAAAVTGFRETTVNGVRAFTASYDAGENIDGINTLYKQGQRLPRATYPKTGEFAVADVHAADCFDPEDDYFAIHAAFYAKTADLLPFRHLEDVDVHILHYWCDELLPLHSLDLQTGRIEVQKPASMNIRKGDRYLFENVFEALSEPNEWYYDRTERQIYYIPQADEQPETTVLDLGATDTLITVDGCRNLTFCGITFCDTDWSMQSGSQG